MVALRPRVDPAGALPGEQLLRHLGHRRSSGCSSSTAWSTADELAAGHASEPAPIERTGCSPPDAVGRTLASRSGSTERPATRAGALRRRRPGAGPRDAPRRPHPPAPLRPRPRRHVEARARLPRVPGPPRPRRRRGSAVAVHGRVRRRASCGAPTPTRRVTVSVDAFEPYLEPCSDASPSRSSPSRGRRRRSRSPSPCRSGARSRRPSGPRRSAPRSRAGRTDAVRTTSTGSPRSSPWSTPRASPTPTRSPACRDAWARAAGRTPHGSPIELAPADFAA